MRHAVCKEGRFAPLFCLAFVALAAAEEPASELALCAEQPSDALKLACFEALAARYRQESSAEATPPAEPAPAAEPASIVELAAGVERAPATDSETRELDAATGREHLPARAAGEPPAAEVVTATVVAVTRRPVTRELTFEMDNGQVWRQMEAGHYRYPKDGAFDVEIRQGLMGDYQMRVGGEGRMTRIVRVK